MDKGHTMPRQPRGYREHGSIREQFVQRMTDEQARQGLSDAALAKLVSEHYPMSSATIWKIKKFEPPKRVDLDENHAIALALGFDNFQDLLLLGDQARHQSGLVTNGSECQAIFRELRSVLGWQHPRIQGCRACLSHKHRPARRSRPQ